MTVTYTFDVSSSSPYVFIKTLFRWRGSVWKSILVELIVWCIFYTIISLVYRLALNDFQKGVFERICFHCAQYGSLLPVTYMLGYFVTHVVTRWTEMLFRAIGWIDNVALLIATFVVGQSRRADLYRRTMIRYLMVVQIMALRIVAPAMKRRFPTLDALVDAGFARQDERQHLQDSKFYMACTWAVRLLEDAKAEGFIKCDHDLQTILTYMLDFRKNSMTSVLYDYFSLPICYLHVIYLCVRIFVIVALLGRQIVDSNKYPERTPVDCYVPFLTIIQFIFIVGWCKVAEALLNPWGEDDDDYEVNFIVDRNMRVGRTIVTNAERVPPLVKDAFWDEEDAEPLYSLETALVPQNPCMGSTAYLATDSRRGSQIQQPVVMVRRLSNATPYEEFETHVRQMQRKAMQQENKTNERRLPFFKGGSLRRSRKYSLPSAIRLQSTNADKPSMMEPSILEHQASRPALRALSVETISEIPGLAKKDSFDANKHVHWRGGVGEGSPSKTTKKTIDDVKLALRKCSSNFVDLPLDEEDEDKANEENIRNEINEEHQKDNQSKQDEDQPADYPEDANSKKTN